MISLKQIFKKNKAVSEIHDAVCKKVIEDYCTKDLSVSGSLDYLIRKVNMDSDFADIQRRNGSHILINGCPKGEAKMLAGILINLNFSQEEGLHLRYWDYFGSIRDDKIVPVKKGEDIQKAYPITAEDLRAVIVSYILDSDKKFYGQTEK